MTTITLRDGVMAADGKGSSASLAVSRSHNKIFISAKHQFIAGFAGDPAEALRVLHLFEELDVLPWDSNASEILFDDLDGTGVMIAHKDGRVIFIQGVAWFEAHDESFHVLGSGTPIALGAFHMGATAEQALEAACVFDNDSGGKCRSFELKDIPALPLKPSVPKKKAVKKH